jgi:hypothetical protein
MNSGFAISKACDASFPASATRSCTRAAASAMRALFVAGGRPWRPAPYGHQACPEAWTRRVLPLTATKAGPILYVELSPHVSVIQVGGYPHHSPPTTVRDTPPPFPLRQGFLCSLRPPWRPQLSEVDWQSPLASAPDSRGLAPGSPGGIPSVARAAIQTMGGLLDRHGVDRPLGPRLDTLRFTLAAADRGGRRRGAGKEPLPYGFAEEAHSERCCQQQGCARVRSGWLCPVDDSPVSGV